MWLSGMIRGGCLLPSRAEIVGVWIHIWQSYWDVVAALQHIVLNVQGKGVIEMEAQKVVRILQNRQEESSVCGFIDADCLELLHSRPDISLQRVSHDCNLAAHQLAQAACNFSDHHIWESLPQIMDVIFAN